VFSVLCYTDAVNSQNVPIGLRFFSYSGILQTPTHTPKNMCDVATGGINDNSYGNTDNNTPL
jgi:hypothetical protein